VGITSHIQTRLKKSSLLFGLKQEFDILPSVLSGEKAAARSWSQFGEDEILCSELADLLQTGYYLDIGANHPTKISNTFRLYAKGMRGIVVEPDPTLCRLHAKYRSGDIQLCAASGERDSLAPFYRMSYHGLSTFSREDCERSIAGGAQLLSTSLVPVFTIRTILSDCKMEGRPAFALLSVDTESLDEVVLRSNDWCKYRPRIVVYENNDGTDSTRNFLSSVGYELIASKGCNEIMRMRA
jgi:FkbM family methyltransferase